MNEELKHTWNNCCNYLSMPLSHSALVIKMGRWCWDGLLITQRLLYYVFPGPLIFPGGWGNEGAEYKFPIELYIQNEMTVDEIVLYSLHKVHTCLLYTPHEYITVMSHERHDVSNQRQRVCLINSLFNLSSKNKEAPYHWSFVSGINQ